MLLAAASLALRALAQIGVAVSAPAEIDARDPVLVRVEVTTPVGRDVRVEAPSFSPFRLLRATQLTGVDSAPARRRASVGAWQVAEFRYVLEPPPNASGRYAFAGFTARSYARGLRPAVARSRGWEVAVRGAAPPARVPAIVARVTPRPRAGISFHALAVPETVYVGQQSTYQVAVFLDDDVRTRLRRNPEFLPPEMRSMLAYDLVGGRTSLRGHVVDGRSYDVHVFQRAVFPLAPGPVAIAPAQLSYFLPLSSGFFSREESYTARSEPARVVALEPPTAGRPAGWNGAVGVLAATARVDTAAARVGDAIVYTLRVEGIGNVKLLPRPAFALAWGTAVSSDERVTVDSTSVTVRGAKEFDWIVTPRDTGAREIPPVRYPFFDPYRGEYDVSTSRPVTVRVTPGALAFVAGDSAGAPPLPIRPVYAGAAPTPLPSRPVFWALVALVPLPAVVIALLRRPRSAPRRRTPREQLDALVAASRSSSPTAGWVGGDARAVRRALVAALAERLALPPDAIARRAGVATLLRRRGVTGDTAAATAALLTRLDEGAYGRPAPNALPERASAAAEARELVRRADGEAASGGRAFAARVSGVKPTAAGRAGSLGRRRRGALVVLAAIGASAATSSAADSALASAAFGRGVRAYESRHFAAAQREFETAAAAEPRAPDAWANAGTAAWAAGDTVAATVGWQRALRLEPLADDLRARLALLPSAQGGRIASVPPLSSDALFAIAVGCWALGWLALAKRLHSRTARPAGPDARGAWLGRAAAGSLVAATAVGVSAAALADAIRADRVAVVRAPGPLHTDPVLGSELGPPVQLSDIARAGARVGVWTRVELDGGRAGWIESDRLVPLDTPDGGSR